MKGQSFTGHKIHIFLLYDRKICLMWHFSWSNYKMKCVRGSCDAGGFGGGRRGRKGWPTYNSVACEGSNAAPSLLSTWLQVLIQLSSLDHRCIDSAGQRELGDWTDSRAGLSFLGTLQQDLYPSTFDIGASRSCSICDVSYHQPKTGVCNDQFFKENQTKL